MRDGAWLAGRSAARGACYPYSKSGVSGRGWGCGLPTYRALGDGEAQHVLRPLKLNPVRRRLPPQSPRWAPPGTPPRCACGCGGCCPFWRGRRCWLRWGRSSNGGRPAAPRGPRSRWPRSTAHHPRGATWSWASWGTTRSTSTGGGRRRRRAHGRAGVPRARGVPSQQPCTAPVGRVRTHVGAVPPPPAPPACTHPRLCALALQPAPPHHTHTHLHPPAHSWLDDRESRNWDLVVVYWGERDNFTCADCVGVLRQQGPKWRLVHALVSGNNSAWEAVAQRPRPHEAVMVADDDVSGAGAGAVGGGGGRPSSAGHAWEGGEGGAGRAAQSV